ncbi:MAG: DUF6240 domain-containing protein [Lachnospiraceae bacterium]|nr:DUF6240 domain-containing protein [Lachnospiraceae bacterium]
MRIDFIQPEKSNTDIRAAYTTKEATAEAATKKAVSGYKLDISGKVMDNAAFDFKEGKAFTSKSQGKTLQESLEDMDSFDAQTMHNYMAVMSNCMSGEDFSKLAQDGYEIKQISADEAVSNLDRIKVELAMSGVHVAGYTDNLDANAVKEIAGSEIKTDALEGDIIRDTFKNADLPDTGHNIKAAEQAIETAAELKPLTENDIRYMVDNSLEPTIENVMMAEFKSGSMVLQKNNSIDISTFLGQVDEIIENAGFEVSEETRADAQYLMEMGLPLDVESLQNYEDLKNLEIPVNTADLTEEIALAIASGKEAKDAYLIKGYNAIKAERKLRETELAMTTEANRKLNQSSFSIDTKEIETKVDALKEKEQQYFKLAFSGSASEELTVEKMGDLFNETLEKVGAIKEMPAAILARFDSAEAFTVNDVYEAGQSELQKYNNVVATYEAVGTEVRADLGDNIKKAFANVDDILKDLGYQTTLDNERAVRILGYNSIEINAENIDRVKAADSTVNRLLKLMTPANTASLIKDKFNPLSTNVTELINKLESFEDQENTTFTVKDSDDYAKFLIKLEQSGEFTEEERTSYIGIYRLLDKIEKSDGAVIGSLLESGKELSLRNLLSEVRSRKKGSTDVTVDDDFGGVSAGADPNMKIDRQIDMAFKAVYLEGESAALKDALDPAALKQAQITSESALEAVIDANKRYNKENNENLNKALSEETLNSLREAADREIAVYEALMDYNRPVSADNVNAMAALMTNSRGLFKGIRDLSDEEEKDGLDKATEDFIESLDSEESAEDAALKMDRIEQEILENAMERIDSRIDLQAIQAMNKQLSLKRELVHEENYRIPVEIDGEIAAINLKVVRGTGKLSAEITMETEREGEIKADISLRDGALESNMTAKTGEGYSLIGRIREDFEAALSGLGAETDNESALLYKASKEFIMTVRRA